MFVVASMACRWGRGLLDGRGRRRRGAVVLDTSGWTWARPRRACYPQSIFPLPSFVFFRAGALTGPSDGLIGKGIKQAGHAGRGHSRFHTTHAYGIRSQDSKALVHNTRALTQKLGLQETSQEAHHDAI